MTTALFLLLCCLAPLSVKAQGELSPDTVVGRVWRQTNLFPNEKLHLPASRSDAYTLNVREHKEYYYVSALTGMEASDAVRLLLLVHQRGYPLFAQSLLPGQPVRIGKDSFLSGVAHFVLLSPQGKIISERLSFVRCPHRVSASVRPDKPAYGARDKVTLAVSLNRAGDTPFQGDFSVAVTDDADVLPDSTHTIYTSLLLSSELRGYIKDPGRYFRTEDRSVREELDVLMQVQGWRRYNVDSALVAAYRHPDIPIEDGQYLCGSVTRPLGGKGISNAGVQVHVPSLKILEEVRTDGEGIFRFGAFEVPDSTFVHLRALSSKGKENVLLSVDSVSYPQAFPLPVFRPDEEVRVSSSVSGGEDLHREFREKALRRSSYEDGMRHILMDNVTVTARKREKLKTVYEGIVNSITIKEEEIRNTPRMDFPIFLQRSLPGLIYTRKGFYYREKVDVENGGNVRIILNDFLIDDQIQAVQTLHNLSMTDVEQITFSRDAATGLAFIPGIEGGAFIAITLKKDVAMPYDVPQNLRKLCYAGFQKPEAFYAPRYEALRQKESTVPDLRTTLYWHPQVHTDKEGNATFEFYTADSAAPCSVVVEGITADGEIFRTVQKINVE